MVVIHGLESGFSGKEKEQQRQACITNQLIRQVTQPSPVPCFGGNDVVNPSIRHYFISINIYYLFATYAAVIKYPLRILVVAIVFECVSSRGFHQCTMHIPDQGNTQ